MQSQVSSIPGGLEGIIVADTRLSEVDGQRGRLIIAGYDVERLVERASFEDVFYLLWHGELPSPAAREEVRVALGDARARAFALLPSLGDALGLPNGMEALRAAVGHLTVSGADLWAESVALAGAIPVFAASWWRLSQKEAPLAPDPGLSHAADYLRLVRGALPEEAEVRALDTYLVTVSDHGMNASTFTARVVASTGSDTVSAVVAALGALKGPLHGGAPGPVLDMLDAVGTPERAHAWIRAELSAGRRIMGMGHRVYRVRDPRAAVLEKAVRALEEKGAPNPRLTLARAVERAAEEILQERYPNRPLRANVEFYTAVLLDALGIPRELFSPTFAVGRVAGWCAHIKEQRETGRLIRPSSRYIGGTKPLPH